MRGLTHQLIGVSAAAVAGAALDLPTAASAALAAAAALGSLLPDADEARARIHQRTRWERRNPLVAALVAAVRLPLLLVAVLPHRGVTHWPPVALLLPALLAWALDGAGAGAAATVLVAGGLGLGYALHLAADACTPSGIPGWPVARRVRLLPAGHRVATGSRREAALAALVAAIAVASVALLT